MADASNSSAAEGVDLPVSAEAWFDGPVFAEELNKTAHVV